MLTQKKKALAAAMCAIAMLTAQPSQAQIPVTDALQIAQEAYQHVETLGKWVQQYQQLRAQIELYTYQLESLTGRRGLGGIFNALQAEGMVPDDVRQIVLLATDAKAKLEQIDHVVKNGINHTTLRQGQLQQLLRQIDATEDPKAIAELQARMSGEQVAVQNEGNRLAALSEQMRNQERLVTQAVNEWRNNQRLMALQ
ncbi:type IV secretion system protein [Hydrogenophaga pseudoflava]|uniref:Type IV secretion system protein virB5 n=1 Tax=Hydrogenophaga pseudoflava TaxID=47421 RepID=A0A4P6XA43_HYDPS|nr:type IV secretion system protein [Hydrogenophaga pseudoflava]QBM30644.1 Type IV secretion system protein virB5 precursor [Hydrogenophaga pseudoflava]